MSVADDGRALRLSEHLGQRDHRRAGATEQIGEHAARTDAGQLVGVADQHQPAPGLQRRQERAHQREIHHRRFIHNHRIRLKRLFFILLKCDLARVLVPGHAEQTVDGLRVTPAELAHALGGASGGRSQQHVQTHTLIERQNRAHGGGLARARTTGKEQQSHLCRQLHCPPL